MAKHYKNHLSDYDTWNQLLHAEGWVLFKENISDTLCLDEVSLSNGELYTVLTNAHAQTRQGSLISMVKGVKSEDVIDILKKIPLQEREKVKEISLDMANNMERIAKKLFPKAFIVTDRFHVAKLVSDAVQQIRIKHRWEAIAEENKKTKKAKAQGKRYISKTYENGDTKKQLLARSRYLLFKPENKRTERQQKRAEILFREYPQIKHAYELSMNFRNIYQTCKSIPEAKAAFEKWFAKIDEHGYESFITAAESIKNHYEYILNFFINRTTNALAETFNSKLKAFRAVFRGVRDLTFFIYRVSKIFA